MLALIYQQFDPLYNTGAAQSGVVQLNAIIRRPAVATQLALTLAGTSGATVVAGALVQTVDGANQFSIDATVTIGGGGTVAAPATSLVGGPVVVTDSTALAIATPSTGWTGAVVTSTTIAGLAGETDDQLRLRQQISTSSTSYRQIEAIYAAVLNVPGVTYCRAYQNNTMTTDGDTSISAKSIAVVVLGGNDTDVAKAIFARVPVGVGYYGTTSVTLTDSQGQDYTISFMRPTPVAIDVAMTITQVDDSFPSTTYEADIKAAILSYVQSGAVGLGVPTGFERQGIVPGVDVYPSMLYTPINSVSGFQVTALGACLHGGSPAMTAITIAWNEVAAFTAGNISITLV
jgi:uncharacterized phage protein gp47/JayE